jgi:hypothetical protein
MWHSKGKIKTKLTGSLKMGAWGFFDHESDDFLDDLGDLVNRLMKQDPVAVRELERINASNNFDEIYEYEQKWKETNVQLLGDNSFDLKGKSVIGAMMYVANIGAEGRFLGPIEQNTRKMYCHPAIAYAAREKIVYLFQNPQITEEEGWSNVEKRLEALRFELKVADLMLNSPPDSHYTVIDAPEPPN